MSQFTQVQVQRLVDAANRWADFQDGDSLEDQETDTRLKAQAIEARERLLSAIEELSR